MVVAAREEVRAAVVMAAVVMVAEAMAVVETEVAMVVAATEGVKAEVEAGPSDGCPRSPR
jgi:hypothetical protein